MGRSLELLLARLLYPAEPKQLACRLIVQITSRFSRRLSGVRSSCRSQLCSPSPQFARNDGNPRSIPCTSLVTMYPFQSPLPCSRLATESRSTSQAGANSIFNPVAGNHIGYSPTNCCFFATQPARDIEKESDISTTTRLMKLNISIIS